MPRNKGSGRAFSRPIRDGAGVTREGAFCLGRLPFSPLNLAITVRDRYNSSRSNQSLFCMSVFPSPPRYFVSHNGQIKGPFDLDMIEAFILSGHYEEGVRIRAEGADQWTSHFATTKTSPPPIPVTPKAGDSAQSPRIPKWVFIGVGVFVLMLLIKFNTGETEPAAAAPFDPAASGLLPVDAPKITTGPKPAFDPSKPFEVIDEPATARPSTDVIYRDTNGRTYRVPRSAYLRLSELRTAIDKEEAAISAIQAGQKRQSDNIEARRMYLDRTSQYEIDSFNATIDSLNAAQARLQHRIDVFNLRVDAFNAELERVGTPSR